MMTQPVDRRKQTGDLGEELAVHYLEQLGYLIKERNWRCRSGEIDLIARLGDQLIFVEVRTRSSSSRFGTAAESVSYRKQNKVRQTAQVYLTMSAIANTPIRFDVITVMLNKDNSAKQIDHYKNAF